MKKYLSEVALWLGWVLMVPAAFWADGDSYNVLSGLAVATLILSLLSSLRERRRRDRVGAANTEPKP